MLGTPETSAHAAAQIVRVLYGDGFGAPRLVPILRDNPQQNALFFLEFDGKRSDAVLKLCGEHREEKILREQQALPVLLALGFAVPRVEATQNDQPGLDAGLFTIMERLIGDTLEATYARKPEWTQAAWEKAGRFLASLHTVPLSAVPLAKAVLPSDYLRVWRLTEERLEAANLRTPFFADVLTEVRPILDRPRPHFTNHDYSAGQIITDGTAFGVADWEYAGAGFLTQTLADFSANAVQNGGASHYVEAVHNGFSAVLPLTPVLKNEVRVLQAYSHLKTAGVQAMRGNREKAQQVCALVEHHPEN